jgi:cell division protein FtsL
MNRLMIIGLLVVAVLAIGVYRAKLGASETQARTTALNEEVRRANEDIGVLRAEEVYLSQPQRIGPIARERLGLAPAGNDQFTAPEQLARRVGEARLPPEQPDPARGSTMTAPPVPALRAQASPSPAAPGTPR